jgi:hypothetical protein
MEGKAVIDKLNNLSLIDNSRFDGRWALENQTEELI